MHLPPDRAAWRARTDGPEPDQLRWHQIVHLAQDAAALPVLTKGQVGIAIIGFASDEGVVRNLGRVGAVEGPAALRHYCAGLPLHVDSAQLLLADMGTVACINGQLEEAQVHLGAQIATAQAAGYRTLVFGGGHEVAYGHWLGLAAGLDAGQAAGLAAGQAAGFAAGLAAGVVNFDAHLDLRPIVHGARHSGNSFMAIAQDCARQGRRFGYTAVGIQRIGNTRKLFADAQNIGTTILLGQELDGHMLPAATALLAESLAATPPQMLSIDMDVFSASLAPGVSAPNALGILPGPAFLALLRQVLHAPSLRSMDIAELNPRYDVDGRTARLGAALAFEAVQAWAG